MKKLLYFIGFLWMMTSLTGQVRITEVYYDTHFAEEVSASDHHLGEFIELYNPGEYTINVGGWVLKDNYTSYKIPYSTYIKPHDYLIIANGCINSKAKWEGYFPRFFPTAKGHESKILYNCGLLLHNGSDKVLLYNGGRLIDQVTYGKAGMSTCGSACIKTSIDNHDGGWFTGAIRKQHTLSLQLKGLSTANSYEQMEATPFATPVTSLTKWYPDADEDGYGDPAYLKVQYHQPSGYVNNNLDCDDGDRLLTPTTKWYRDADSDGYGNPNVSKMQCIKPSGYVLNNQDCNDTHASLNPTTKWYADTDGDGYGNPNSYKAQCTQPSGYVSNNQDCNDNDVSINSTMKWYRDADGDGYGNPDSSKTQCNQPSGYVSNNQDCNDSNASLNPTTRWYQDIDGDGYGNPNNSKAQCTQPSGYVLNNQDCNDSNASLNPTTKWYQDSDGDGYGNPNNMKTQCTQPLGYISNNSDCNDSNATINPTTKWYQDTDGDGYGNPSSSKTQCTQPTGYVSNADDQCPSLAGNQTNGCPPGMTPTNLSDQNYIYVKEPLEAVTSVNTGTKKVQRIQYFDGLGRPMQSIGIGASPLGKDVITPIVYDEFGRQAKDYLPYAGSQNTGAYVDNTTAITGVETYYNTHYNDATPFSEKELEASPLSRVLKQAAPGAAWKMGSGHEIEFGYQSNTTNEVKLFKVKLTSRVPQLEVSGYYAVGQLYKTVTKDENHSSGSAHTIEEFKDKEGRVVLKRTYGEAGSSATATAHDTYYVYDAYGNLTYVLPPKMKGNTANLAELGYQYRYDERNRLIEKQLPGKDREYMVYDTQDRLVATQDGLQRTQGVWLFTKYDQFGRVLYTGTTNGGTDRASVQSAVTAKGKNNETSGSFTHSGITVPYTNSTAYPTSITELFTVNVYDAYPSDAPSAPSSVEGQAIASTSTTPNLKGLATASYVKVINPPLGEPGGWTKTYTYYDLKARPVRSYSKNHLGGSTISDSKLDFRGKPEYTKTQHKRTNSDSEQTTITYFTYDHAERLVKTEQKDTGDGTKITLSENTYDELGQLTSKKVGNNLQTVDYAYNIRGWLTNINNINQQGSDLFAFKINYNELESSGVSNVQGLYNGNISETFWKTTDNIKRGYVYKYDALNRLKAGYYLKNSGAPGYFNVENITYDENGNILSLKRNGTSDTSVVLMDQLSYTYDQGNRLTKVDDTSNNTHGFKDGVKQTNEYTYDVNGNMTEDKNKSITGIAYNYLNLPTQITFVNGNKIEYLYDAAGMKLQKKVFEGSKTTVTEYIDGYQYVDGKLEFYPHSEGYVKVKDDNTLQYVYHYTDHLGNVRLSYTKGSDGKAQVVEESNYYPFGLKHSTYNTVVDPIAEKYKYGYNGKEGQDELGLNWNDYGARNYDPALGRWMNVDLLAEKYSSASPYAYVVNNPINAIDPDGKDIIFLTGISAEIQATIVAELSELTGLTLSVNEQGKLNYTTQESYEGGSSKARNMLISAIENETKHYEIDNRNGEGSSVEEKFIRGIGKDAEGNVLQDITYDLNIDVDQIKGFIEGTSKDLNDKTLGFGMTTLHEFSHKENELEDDKSTFGATGANVDFMNDVRKELDNSGKFSKPFGQRKSYAPIRKFSVKGTFDYIPFDTSSYESIRDGNFNLQNSLFIKKEAN